MASTDIIAIYAAVVATGVLFWDVYKWFRTERVRLVGRVMTNAMLVGVGFAGETRKRWMSLTVDNRGHLTCTVTRFDVVSYKNWFYQLRGRAHFWAVINTSGSHGNSVPYVLEPGRSFMGLALQTPDIETRSRAERLYIAIGHSGSDKPILFRIRPIQDQPNSDT